MRTSIAFTLLLSAILGFASCNSAVHRSNNIDQTTAEALETWHNDHFGMFIHFGVYSKLAGVWQGEKVPFYSEQIMNHARITIPEYEAVARTFNPTEFNADEIVDLAIHAGMKYIVITTKHHDGFCMFDTKTTDYDIVDFTPYGKDVVGQLAEACHRKGMKLGFYYSLPDWHFPNGIARLAPDSASKCWEFVNQVYSPLERVTPELEEYIVEQITELLTQYGEITTIWFDMGLITPEQSRRFRETVKSLQPKCLINGRIMNNMGDYMTLPDNGAVASYGDVYWDNPASLYGTWGYNCWINRPDVESQIEKQFARLTSTVGNGGVFLLNIGPDGEGRVIDYEKQVLNGIGDSLRKRPNLLDSLAEMHKNKATEAAPVLAEQGTFILTPENGQWHAALDGTGYMSIEMQSWISWQIDCAEACEYDLFVIYEPENDDKSYSVTCEDQILTQVLPGVDRMKQTSHMGRLTIKQGIHTLKLDQAYRARPLEPLGLTLHQIVLRKRK